MFFEWGFLSKDWVIGLVQALGNFAIRVYAVEHGLSPQALRDEVRLGTLGAGRLKSSYIFP